MNENQIEMPSDDTILEARLAAALFRVNCPDPGNLAAYKWGLLSENITQTVSTHLAQCPHCAAELTDIPEPAPRSSSPPILPPQQTRSGLPVFFAELLVKAVFSARSGLSARGQAGTSQWYQISELDWDLTLSWLPAPGSTFIIQGQLLGPETDLMTTIQLSLVTAETGTTSLAATQPDADGIFAFTDIPQGTYGLRIETSQGIIPISDIQPNLP